MYYNVATKHVFMRVHMNEYNTLKEYRLKSDICIPEMFVNICKYARIEYKKKDKRSEVKALSKTVFTNFWNYRFILFLWFYRKYSIRISLLFGDFNKIIYDNFPKHTIIFKNKLISFLSMFCRNRNDVQ